MERDRCRFGEGEGAIYQEWKLQAREAEDEEERNSIFNRQRGQYFEGHGDIEDREREGERREEDKEGFDGEEGCGTF